MKFIIFIDALDYRDIGPWMKQYANEYIPSVPRVTPNVISQIMTGKRRKEWVRPTPYKEQRPKLIKRSVLNGIKGKVFHYGIPFVQCPNIQIPRPGGDFLTDDHDNIFNGQLDYISMLFPYMRLLARNQGFDVMFLGFNMLDVYTHWYDEKAKQDLIKVIEIQLAHTQQSMKADILFFSDHGSTNKVCDFRINKWLKEKGWLDYEINYEFFNYHRRKNQCKDQLVLQSPFVKINWKKTKFYCNDAFDSMIDCKKATAEDKEKLKKQLMETGYFDSVGEEFGLIIPECKDGVHVSSDVHKNAETGDNIPNKRKGWHSRHAVIGCTSMDTSHVKSELDIYNLIKEFTKTKRKKKDEEIIADRLNALGYI